MGSFVKESDRRKKVWSMSMVNAWATCSVGYFHGVQQGECPPAAEGNGNLTGQGRGNAVFFFAAGSRSLGAHLNKSSGRGPPGSRFSAPSGVE